uniref:Cytochrome c oxidase subunit 3 n=2 Tax=Leptotrombidium pallidum TaxID=279272 RepID=Q4W8D5_9ACAR|nr:cytochrome c oxidase subunit III [Leptotrombidium pallidum]BAD99504.1 cytochrome oxidase subunit 3 [Leptotrombidium pallidum]
MKKFQVLHLVSPSPWPIIGSFSGMYLIGSGVLLMHSSDNLVLFASLITLLLMFSWWSDVFSEASLEGGHSKKTVNLLKLGMILFIVSEIFLFISPFWAFFHSSSSPNVEIGSIWPPQKVVPFPVEEIPLLNTIILLSSGGTLTAAHHFLLKGEKKHSSSLMKLTILLGMLFTLLQGYEYLEAKFSMSDSSFGSAFFLATGFHGAHVIVGSIFLSACLFQIDKSKISFSQFICFEASAWYWHFVDVVWLFLFISIYWWGS